MSLTLAMIARVSALCASVCAHVASECAPAMKMSHETHASTTKPSSTKFRILRLFVSLPVAAESVAGALVLT